MTTRSNSKASSLRKARSFRRCACTSASAAPAMVASFRVCRAARCVEETDDGALGVCRGRGCGAARGQPAAPSHLAHQRVRPVGHAAHHHGWQLLLRSRALARGRGRRRIRIADDVNRARHGTARRLQATPTLGTSGGVVRTARLARPRRLPADAHRRRRPSPARTAASRPEARSRGCRRWRAARRAGLARPGCAPDAARSQRPWLPSLRSDTHAPAAAARASLAARRSPAAHRTHT